MTHISLNITEQPAVSQYKSVDTGPPGDIGTAVGIPALPRDIPMGKHFGIAKTLQNTSLVVTLGKLLLIIIGNISLSWD